MNNHDLEDHSVELFEAITEKCGRFCSTCSKEVKQNKEEKYVCSICGNDDLQFFKDFWATWDWEDLLESTVKEELEEVDTNEAYAEMLDEGYEEAKVCGYTYCASRALETLDPITYRCGYADYLSAESSDGRWCEVDGAYYDKEEVLALWGLSA